MDTAPPIATPRLATPRHPNLVFTSAGDRGTVERWRAEPAPFDLWVTYYGDTPGHLSEVADHYAERRGGKFPNLDAAYRAHPDTFRAYERVAVLDDDIVLSPRDITRLFEILDEERLWALQPAFRVSSMISHSVTRARIRTRLRYTNYVEMACPFIRRDKLEEFLERFDPALVGFGADLAMMDLMGPGRTGRLAIVDEVPCLNPRVHRKGSMDREIDRLQPLEERRRTWEAVKRRDGFTFDVDDIRQHGHVPASPITAVRGGVRMAADYLVLLGGGATRRTLRRFRT